MTFQYVSVVKLFERERRYLFSTEPPVSIGIIPERGRWTGSSTLFRSRGQQTP